MSVILESQHGDELICIERFSAPLEGKRACREAWRTFRIGERVRYQGFFQSDNRNDKPVSWMVRFDAADGQRYAATQTYFVTTECWEGLKRFFARRLLKDPKHRKAPSK